MSRQDPNIRLQEQINRRSRELYPLDDNHNEHLLVYSGGSATDFDSVRHRDKLAWLLDGKRNSNRRVVKQGCPNCEVSQSNHEEK